MNKLELIAKLNNTLGWAPNKDTIEWGNSIIILNQLKETMQWKDEKMHEHRTLKQIGTMDGVKVYMSGNTNRKNATTLRKIRGLLDD